MHRHPPLLAALAQHGHRPPAQVDVAPVEPAQLRDAQPGRVEELEHREVAAVHGRLRRHVEQGGHLAPRQHAGQATAARGARAGTGPGRSRGDPAAPARRSSSAAQPPCGRSWRGPASASPARRGSGAGGGGRRHRAPLCRCGTSTRRRRRRRSRRPCGWPPSARPARRRSRECPSREARQSTVPPPRRGSWALTSPANLRGVRWVRGNGGPMASKFDRRTLLAGGAAAAAGFAGASALGLGWDGIAGAATNGPGRNGVSKATPKKGGSLVFGVDAEEQGFDPTQARFDEVGVMYARTVFDPLTIVTGQRGLGPLPGRVRGAQLLLHQLDRHPAAQRRVPRRHALQRRRAAGQLRGAREVGADRRRHQPDAAVHHPDRPAGRDHLLQVALGAVPLLPGRRHRRPDRLRRGAVHALQPQRHVAPGRHRALRLQGVGPQRPLHRHGQPALLAARACPTCPRSPTSPSPTSRRGRRPSRRARST